MKKLLLLYIMVSPLMQAHVTYPSCSGGEKGTQLCLNVYLKPLASQPTNGLDIEKAITWCNEKRGSKIVVTDDKYKFKCITNIPPNDNL